MRALLLHIGKSDALAESGLKVIAYFDALVEHRATLEACVRAAAALSHCVAGLRDTTSPMWVRFDGRGLPVEGPPAPTTSRPVRIGDRDVGEVWLEREEGPSLLDDLIVERLALAAGVLWRTSPRPSRSTSRLIELVLSADTAVDDCGRALELLGFPSNELLDVAAVTSTDPDQLSTGVSHVQQSFREEQDRPGGRTVVCSAALGSVGAVIAVHKSQSRENSNGQGGLTEVEGGFAAGIARARPGQQVASAWRQAQTAMQFCGLLGFANVVDYDELGSLAVLAELPPSLVKSNADVRAIESLTSTPRSRAVLETLQQRLVSASTREAAAALYLHHSSVRYRLRQAEEALGLELENPRSRLRAELALLLWRLSST